MRKILTLGVLITMTALTGAAQGPSKSPMLTAGATISADKVQTSSPAEVVFSGNVTVVLPGATVTADRVIFRQSSQSYELEGHVQLKPSVPAK